MVSQKWRVDNFEGTALEYITYLESLLLTTANYSPPSRAAQPSPPSSPSPSPSDLPDEAIDTSVGDETHTDLLKFIQYEPLTCSGKRKRGRWEKEMNKVISEMTTDSLGSKRAKTGLSSEADIIKALDIMIYGKPRTNLITDLVTSKVTTMDRRSNILQILDDFAEITTALGVTKSFAGQMCRFRRFLSVSLCCVALHNGTDPELLDEFMKKHISNSSEKNLNRLRNAAL